MQNGIKVAREMVDSDMVGAIRTAIGLISSSSDAAGDGR
jgi:hypothetical protein